MSRERAEHSIGTAKPELRPWVGGWVRGTSGPGEEPRPTSWCCCTHRPWVYERGRGASSGIQSWKLRFARSAAGWFRVTRGSGHVPIWLGWDSGNLLGLCPPLSLPDGNEPRISELGNLTSGWGGRVLSFISIPSFYTGAAVNASRVELPLVGLVSRDRVSTVRGTTLCCLFLVRVD